MNDKLKKIIFDKLYQDLKNVEIIPFNDSIWFIDREKKYWYFEYKKPGTLFWRYGFFDSYFSLFSLERDDCKQVMSEWVEEVLNCKVNLSAAQTWDLAKRVEEVLNCKVNTTVLMNHRIGELVEEVLHCKVNTTLMDVTTETWQVEEVLNCKVHTTICAVGSPTMKVEEVLNCKVKSSHEVIFQRDFMIEDILDINKPS